MAYEIFLIAFGVFGLAWLFASNRQNTARRVWSPIDKGRNVIGAIVALASLYVALTAGGFVALAGLAAVFLIGIGVYVETGGSLGLSRLVPARIRRWI